MAAYLLADIVVKDEHRYETYKLLAGATLEKYGGRYLVRGGPTESLEGHWQPNRLVIVEFESLERAREWYASVAYDPAKKLRQEISVTKMILVDGAL